MHFNEASGGVRKFPVAVDERFGRFFKGRAVFGRSKGLVKGQTLRDVGHIGRGEERRGVKIDIRRELQRIARLRRLAAL